MPNSLSGVISVGGPRGVRITADMGGTDPGMRSFIGNESENYAFYLVYLSISFASRRGSRLRFATVTPNLSSDPIEPQPIVLSMNPMRSSQQAASNQEIRLGPKL
jgi:hypothetical protein